MISFKEFIEQEELNESFKKKLGAVMAAGLVAGAAGGAKLGDDHVRAKNIERAVHSALSDPHAERIPSELPKSKMGNFHTSYGFDDDKAAAARGKLTMPQNDKRMSQARGREIKPEAEWAAERPRDYYAGGRFTINNRNPTPQTNSWFGSGNIKVETPSKKDKK
jgi:hypothetical protein